MAITAAAILLSLSNGGAQEFQFGLFSYEIVNAEVVITDYETTATGAVAVPSSIAGFPVRSIGNSALRSCRDITSVAMPPGVTSIGLEAFLGCHSLAAIAVPESVTSFGESAFEDCRSLRSIALPKVIDALAGGVFAGCDALESVTFTGPAPSSTEADTFSGAPPNLNVYYPPRYASGFDPSPWSGIDPIPLTYEAAPPLFSIRRGPDGLLIGVPSMFVPLAVVGIRPVHGRTVGIEYSPDLSEASWIDLGDFTPNASYPDGTWIYADVDLETFRTLRPAGYYRAFLREPAPE